MTTIRVRATVGDDHRVVVTLPVEVPPGEHEFEITLRDTAPTFQVALPDNDRPKRFPSRPTNPDLVPDYEAFERMLPELMKTHAGKYVALRGGVVVAVGNTEIDALTTAHRQSPGTLVYTRLVTDQPQPIPRIGSPRIVRKGST